MDIRHILKYEYIPENVRENNLKCGHKYKYILGMFERAISIAELSGPDEGAVHELPEKIDAAGIRAENLNWDNY